MRFKLFNTFGIAINLNGTTNKRHHLKTFWLLKVCRLVPRQPYMKSQKFGDVCMYKCIEEAYILKILLDLECIKHTHKGR